MQRYFDTIIDRNGNPAPGVNVYVYDAGASTSLVTIYDPNENNIDPVNDIANPITTGADGRVAFAVPNGRYRIVYTGGNIANRQMDWVAMLDGSGGYIATGTLAQFDPTTSAQLASVITDETGTGPLVFANNSVLGNITVTSVNGGTPALTSNKLSAFAATTSAELKGVISDETGSGALVFANTPTLVTPVLGAATATSINSTTIPTSKTLVVTTDKLSALAATTSSELAGVISDETGSGKLVFQTSPDLITPTFSDGIIMSKTSGEGIKVDTSTPTFPWVDLIGNVGIRGIGATDPSFNIYSGTLRQFQFTVNDEVFLEFHLPHDYVPSSDIYIHAHWSHAATTVTGGSVTWGFTVSAAKGHNQAAFIAEVATTSQQNASTTRYQHMIAEVQLSSSSPSIYQINNSTLEPDSLILVRCHLSANAMTVSGGGVPEPYLHFVDIHYQSTGIGTKQKAPNFYT